MSKTPSPASQRPLCIHHANCLDGFAGAWVVNTAHAETGVELYPGKHQQPPPDVRGRELILVDFSYKRDVLLAMAEAANSILILDHHKSAQADLIDLPDNVTAIFDMERCGAMIGWGHYVPDRRPPALLAHIQDQDLWRFALPGTREITALLASYPFSLSEWGRFMREDPEALREEGEPILRQHDKDVRELVERLAYRAEIAGYEVPVINVPGKYSSDVGALLCAGEPFAACYCDTATGRSFSLRSNPQGIDVSEIAAQFGGGGHRNAAGFRIEGRPPLGIG
jgi:oligoribonuclease NrnB/cAMP/cGMP phosphodiesterase (DHH superfamily)